MAVLYERVRAVLASLPGEAVAADALSLESLGPAPQVPPWLLLPIWVDEAWRAHGTQAVRQEALEEILWGQYSLFLHVRIQDDIFDGQRDDLRLVFAADRFLIESLEAFTSFPALSGEFQTFYLQCLRDTVDGILEVSRLEAEAGRFGINDLVLHSRVGAIFKIGVAAVSHLHQRSADLGWLTSLLDLVAVFSQIGDDVQDLAQDLNAGRFTWVGNTLLGVRPGDAITRSEMSSRLSDGLMLDRGQVVIEELRRIALAAAAIVPDTAPLPLRDFVLSLGKHPGRLEQDLHAARVRHVFGELVPVRN